MYTMPTQTQELKYKHLTKLNGTDLSFANVREFERTKHVHRLHPYLGKFIPQLVELFLSYYFKKGDWILDPFMGSGTTLIEANALGMNSVGVEISEFNCLITKVKTKKYNIPEVEKEIKDILYKTNAYSKWLLTEEQESLPKKYKIYKIKNEYFNKWFAKRTINEIFFYRDQIKNYKNQDVLSVILSRATRSARQIAHYDLARPSKPFKETYYCIKHRRTCQPIEEAFKFINRYSWDTIERIKEFDEKRADVKMKVILKDSRYVKLYNDFDGIFTSPPYVGLIDYHEQHKYAYELFDFIKNDKDEIGPASKGKGLQAREAYKRDIAKVFKNASKYLKRNAKIFVVANDRDNLYPEIAKDCNFKIEEIFHRPVLMRTERDNSKFSESIFYFKKE
ncbi:MAG: DNA methyltransferase [Bacteroidota bacterium]